MTRDDVDTQHPVLVTGASGYVAGWIVHALVKAGVTVHAAVRDPGDRAKVGHLAEMDAAGPGKVRFFRADLMEPGSFAAAMAGCRIVLHTASPFATRVGDVHRDLVAPALEGTRNVLETATATPEVDRVVLTSSCAAIYCDAADVAEAPGGVLTEAVWNTRATPDYQPYSYSKTVAERAAWDIAGTQDRWRLVAINPSLVVGPALNPAPSSESFRIVRQMFDGTLRAGAPRIGLGAVDVRDVAQAHLAAAFLPDATGRYIVSGHDTDLLALAQVLADRYGDRYPLPRRALPKWLVWLIGPYVAGLDRRFVARNVGHAWRADNSRSRRELGLSYRPLRQSTEDMVEGMIASGMLPAR